MTIKYIPQSGCSDEEKIDFESGLQNTIKSI